MKYLLFNHFFRILFLLIVSLSAYSSEEDNISSTQETLNMVLVENYEPCSDGLDFESVENNPISNIMLLYGNATFSIGDEIISSNNARAIVSSFNIKTNQLTFYQAARTGFRSFLIGEKITTISGNSGSSTVEEFVHDFVIPCSEMVVSMEENPEQMFFIFSDFSCITALANLPFSTDKE